MLSSSPQPPPSHTCVGVAQRRPLCRFFFASGCDGGTACPYSHDLPEGIATAEEARKTIPCPHHLRGTCRYGDRCRFGHDIDEEGRVKGKTPPCDEAMPTPMPMPRRGQRSEVVVTVPPGMEFWIKDLMPVARASNVHFRPEEPPVEARGTSKRAAADGTTRLRLSGFEDQVWGMAACLERFFRRQRELRERTGWAVNNWENDDDGAKATSGGSPPATVATLVDLDTLGARQALSKLVLKSKRGGKVGSQVIRYKARRCGVEKPLSCDLKEAERRSKAAYSEYLDAKVRAKARSKDFMSFWESENCKGVNVGLGDSHVETMAAAVSLAP